MTQSKEEPQFPYYFRKDGRCIKVLSETQAITIVLPPESLMVERFISRYPTSDRLKETLTGFKQVTEKEFKDFQSTFWIAASEERSTEIAMREKEERRLVKERIKQNHLAE